MVDSILSIIASVLSWAAAVGIDALLGKWVAYFTIAWELYASDNAKKGFAEGVARVSETLPQKYDQWQKARKSLAVTKEPST